MEILHPGRSKEMAKPIAVRWGHIPYNLGSWVHVDEPAMFPGYERAIQPDGPIYLCGEHLSHIVGWQEGAALSAHRAVKLLSQAATQATQAAGRV